MQLQQIDFDLHIKSNDGNLVSVQVPSDNGTTNMYLDTIVGLQSNSNYTILGIKSDPTTRTGVAQEGGGALITKFKGKTTGMFASSFEQVSRTQNGTTNYGDTTISVQVGDPMANGNDNPSMHLGVSKNTTNNKVHNYAELSAYSDNSSNIYNGINMEYYLDSSYGVTRVNTDTLEVHATNFSQNSNNDTYLRVFGKIDVNNSYVLPNSSGQPGEVLKMPAAGGSNELVWGSAGGTSPWSETNFNLGIILYITITIK